MAKDSKKRQSQAEAPAEVEQLQQEAALLTEALQRERADAVNLRRRYDEQLAGVRATVKSAVIAELLPVIDNFERSLRHIPADLADNDYIKGIQSIVKQFDSTLQEMGVQRIGVVGEEFNPHYHEAVSIEESDGENNAEVVSDVLQYGYRFGEDVIRHAMVRVKS